MKLTAFDLLPRRFRLDAPVRTARETFVEREGFRVRVVLADGRTAWGEATPLASFGTELLEDAWRLLSAAKPRVEGEDLPEEVDAVDAWVSRLIPDAAPASRYAVELALLDALAQLRGQALAKILSGRAASTVAVNALLTSEAPEALADEAEARVAEGYRTLKLKLLPLDPAAQAARVMAVRARVGETLALRVDANAAWTLAEARAQLGALRPAGLELCEQPVAADDWAGLEALRAENPCPIAADESVSTPGFSEHLSCVDALVLKPTVLGGLLPSLAWVARAKGRPCVVTHALEGAVARAGAVHLAAALGGGPLAAGVELGRAADPDVSFDAYATRDGQIAIPAASGLGFGVRT